MNRSLLTGFLFLPLGTSVHIYTYGSDIGGESQRRENTRLLDIFKHLESEVCKTSTVGGKKKMYHVAMPVKSLDTSEEFFVVSQRYQDLSMISDSLLKYRQRSLRDLVLLELPKLSLV